MKEYTFKYPGEMFTFEAIVTAEDESEALNLKNAGIKLCEDIGFDVCLALTNKKMPTDIYMRNQIFDVVLYGEFKQANLLQKKHAEYSVDEDIGSLGDAAFMLRFNNNFMFNHSARFCLTKEQCLNPTQTKQEIQSLVKQIRAFDFESFCHAFKNVRDRAITLLLENNYKSTDEEFDHLMSKIGQEECAQYMGLKFLGMPDLAKNTEEVLNLIDDYHANPENKKTILAKIKKMIPAHDPILQKIEDHCNKPRVAQKQNNSGDTLNNNNSTSMPKAYVEHNSSKTKATNRHPANDNTKPSEKMNSSAAKAEFKQNNATNNPFSTLFKLWMLGLVVGSGLAMSGLVPISAVATQMLLGTTLASFGIGICARLYQRLSSQTSLSNETATSKMFSSKDAKDNDFDLENKANSPLIYSGGLQNKNTPPTSEKATSTTNEVTSKLRFGQ